MTAQNVNDTVKGTIQLVNYSNKTTVHGTFHHVKGTGTSTPCWIGTCSINGEGEYGIAVTLVDSGEPGIGIDYIYVSIHMIGDYCGCLSGGNIQVR